MDADNPGTKNVRTPKPPVEGARGQWAYQDLSAGQDANGFRCFQSDVVRVDLFDDS